MNWLCAAILAILVLSIFNGLHRGMVRTALSIASVVVMLFLGNILNPYMSRFLMGKTPVYRTIQENCEKSITETLENTWNQQMDREKQNQFIESLPLPENFIEVLIKNNNTGEGQHFVAQNFGKYLSQSVAQAVLKAVSWVLTFLLAGIIMGILGRLLGGIFSLPGLTLMNKAGGALLGAVRGILIIWFIFLIISLCGNIGWAEEAIEMLQENSVTQFLYHNNLLENLIL